MQTLDYWSGSGNYKVTYQLTSDTQETKNNQMRTQGKSRDKKHEAQSEGSLILTE